MDVSQNASTYIKMLDQWPSKRPQLTGQPPRPPMALPVHQAFLHFPSVLRSENHHLPGSKVQRHRGAGAHAFSGPVARESACVVNRIVLSQSQPPAMPGHARPFPCLVDPDGPWTARFTIGSPGFSSDCDSHEVRECDILVGEITHYMQAGCTRSPLTRKPVKKMLKQIKEAGVPKLASSSSVGRISMLCMKRA